MLAAPAFVTRARPKAALAALLLLVAAVGAGALPASPASGAPAQTAPPTDTWFRLINRHSGKALDDFAWSGTPQASGSVAGIPYGYTLDSAGAVKGIVTAGAGAGRISV